MSPVRAIICDIEGTTTPIDFVHKVLFPYSAKRLRSFVAERLSDEAVLACLEQTKATVAKEEGRQIGHDAAVDQLLAWIEADRKHPALKGLQGMIWKEGYEARAYVSQLYEDVAPTFRRWKEAGLGLGIYSSGSVQAQRLLFGYTAEGDLNSLLDFYFDTAVGAKREKSSYENIAKQLSRSLSDLLFLSDVEEELDAAAAAGLQTIQVVRPGTKAGLRHRVVADLTQIAFGPDA